MCVVGLSGREPYMRIAFGVVMMRMRNLNPCHGGIASAKWADLLLRVVFALHGVHKAGQRGRVG
jgi:hypothetical protein